MGPDNQLRGSQYDSGRGSVTVNNSYWATPSILASESIPNSPVTALTIVYDIWFAPQRIIFYLGSNNQLFGIDDNPPHFPEFSDDSIGAQNITIPLAGTLASYWPYIGFQDSDGQINVIQNNLSIAQNYFPLADWKIQKLGIHVPLGSRMDIVPLSNNFTTIIADGGYGVVYQPTNGQLSISVPNEDLSTTSNQTHSWPQAAQFPTINLPDKAGIAAFATARPFNTKVNTYILYQGTDMSIHMVWLDNDTTWKMSSPRALAVADNGTDISCLTMPTSAVDTQKQQLPLEQASSETRCYYQRAGNIAEFVLSGTDWVELGVLPMT